MACNSTDYVGKDKSIGMYTTKIFTIFVDLPRSINPQAYIIN
jgi:hypothetical protein